MSPTILITGANSGIGYEAARALAQHGAHVVLGCRTRSKADDAVARIDAVGTDRVQAFAADLTRARPALALYGPVAKAPGIEEIRRGLAP